MPYKKRIGTDVISPSRLVQQMWPSTKISPPPHTQWKVGWQQATSKNDLLFAFAFRWFLPRAYPHSTRPQPAFSNWAIRPHSWHRPSCAAGSRARYHASSRIDVDARSPVKIKTIVLVRPGMEMRQSERGTNSKVIEQSVADNDFVLDKLYDLRLDLLIRRRWDPFLSAPFCLDPLKCVHTHLQQDLVVLFHSLITPSI